MLPTITILIALAIVVLVTLKSDWFTRLILGGLYEWLVVEVMEDGKNMIDRSK